MMAIDWERCPSTKFSMFATKCNVKLSQRFAVMTVILYSTSVIVFSSSILVNLVNNDDTAFNVSRLLILEMDLPFDINRKFIYELIIIIQFFHLVLCADAVGLLNALLINLVSLSQKDIIIIMNIISILSITYKNKFFHILLSIVLINWWGLLVYVHIIYIIKDNY